MDPEQKNSDQGEKVDEIVLPGFRFHPTDEELVGFYLERKIQHRPLSIELIRQLDIYKYDPWDLPKMAASGEKEWYFYCPRDRKYRNSTRPNRVTKAGFWKATGTDRPVYSSEPSKCIGLKKSLVFYKGRAAKGTKTDWMMHEFRLPPSSSSLDTKRSLTTSTSESWAICRIFRKTSSVTHRSTTSRSWNSPSISSSQPNLILNSNTTTTTTTSSPYTDQLTPENNDFVSMKTEPHPSIQIGSNGEYYSNEAILNIPPDYYNHQHITMLPPLMDATLPYLTHLHKVNDHHLNNNNNNGDISCVLGENYLVNSSSNFNDACMSLQLEGLHDQLLVGNGVVFSNGTPLMMQEELLQGGDFDRRDDLWDVVKSFRFPISSDIGIL